jgi:D-glycero-D-manno-heptose 1,7-bisphosphate phosphatase
MKRAVFLDRDGVINRAIVRGGKPYAPASLKDLVILPGVVESLQFLHESGWLVFVVTNQPDVARGLVSQSSVEEINQFLKNNLLIDDIRVCYHDNCDDCVCRKPKPGSLLALADKYEVDLSASFMVGDRWSDIEAGKSAGCKSIFIDNEYSERQPGRDVLRVNTLLDAVKKILE